ncbi:hypothetical protein Ahy_A06g026116 [Arachis hypogaea]|uniref:Uncharacterized protein n=1 Tax=Arachis hypogaea TaxID=3818 RepID=A0A445CJH1_ARAHY|nr:hypothetical protein Ahy_A06g026116 [Arachis hypogaea]
MIIYFHLSKNKDKKGGERPPEPWIANWTREQLVERMSAEIEEHMSERTESEEHSTSESETEEDSQDTTKKQPTRKAKKGFRKKQNNEKSAAQGEKEADLRSTEGHYVSSETIPEVNLGSDDPLSQGHTDQSSVNKPAESMLSLVEESANELGKRNMMVVRVETQSQTEALSLVPIQVCLPPSQTTTVPEIELTPLYLFCNPAALQHRGQKLKKAHPHFPLAPSKVNPTPEDYAAALMMMAQTASYIPKQGLIPSFSLGLTDSSQEESTLQEGGRAKTPETPKLIEQLGELVEKIASSRVKTEGKTPHIHKQSGEQSFEKFGTPARTNEMTSDMKERCYIWATRVKRYADGTTNEYDNVCTLIAQDKYILSKLHFASLQAETHI